MRLVRCLSCKGTMEKWKEDSFRIWYKCDNEDCEFVCTEAKPLFNKVIEEVPVKKKGKVPTKKKLDKRK